MAYNKFLPDGIKYENLSKDFLFSVRNILILQLIAHVDPETYGAMYDLYKTKTVQNLYKKWEDYILNINADTLKSINDYVPSKK